MASGASTVLMIRVRTVRSGLFLPAVGVWTEVENGGVLGEVIDPSTGATREWVKSPTFGRVMAMREHPVVYPGTVVGRVVTTKKDGA